MAGPLPRSGLLDTHAHLWDWQLEHYDWMTADLEAIRRPFTSEDLVATVTPHGVDGVVLVQTCSSERETEEYLGLAHRQALIVGVIGWVDLTAADVDDRLARLRAHPGGGALVGIRHQVHDEDDPDWLDRAEVRRGIAAVGAAGLTFDLLVRERELPAAERLVADLPEQRYVIDHLAKPRIAERVRDPWAGRITRVAAHEQVACKLSGLVTEAAWASWTLDDLAPYVEVALEAFGPSRLLFGGDWPVATLAADYGEVLTVTRALLDGLSTSEQQRILAGTGVEVYRLTG
ncbi:MAG: amidohydrolase family protein [Nitriliruptoraceae bacterium]|nr:amidohydrolase family protein [Nitriliruptoraceae bacterium]